MSENTYQFAARQMPLLEAERAKLAARLKEIDALRPYAARRGVSVNALARRIVETVVDEKMVDAVLDDGESA